ncbi:hypothetical protein L2E82_29805 [Cichorium intybus]|uniref:Uncharacterized protein n=1 Tax=Cichorium intybus TaxID=13427 RepID=A0ACB9CYV8_CICIN|nr:hypothetical protein L2E82_29805 [Cichorium intybus]
MSSLWTLEEFKNAIAEDITTPTVSDVNLKEITSYSRWDHFKPYFKIDKKTGTIFAVSYLNSLDLFFLEYITFSVPGYS